MSVHGLSRIDPSARLRALKDSDHASLRGLYVCCRFLRDVTRAVFDPEARSVLVVKYFRSTRAHQIHNVTSTDRYPDLFAASRRYFETTGGLQLLSFGCSTGEEVFTLRTYFPDAHILGLDVNTRSLAVCRARNMDPAIEFHTSTDQILSDRAPFDAVFCLAVLQRSETRAPGVLSSAPIYPFAKFDAQLTALDACLRPGGLMVIDLFKDATVASRYRALDGTGAWRRLAQYDRHNQRIAHPCYNDRIFVKKR